MKNKKGISFIGKTVGIIILILALTIILLFMFGFGIQDFFKIIIPDYITEKPESVNNSLGLECPIQIAYVAGNTIYFCHNYNCDPDTAESKILINGNSIQINQWINEEIGTIVENTFIYIKPSIIKGIVLEDQTADQLIKEIQADVTGKELLLLDNSYFKNSAKKEICTNKIKTVEEYRIEMIAEATGETTIRGMQFYYNIDKLIQNLNSQSTPLYLDKKMENRANSLIKSNGKVSRKKEDSEEQDIQPQEVSANLLRTSTQNFQFYISGEELKEGKESEVFGLTSTVDNTNNKIGIDSNGDPFTKVRYLRWNNNIYVQFHEYAYSDTVTPYIRMEYWDAYRSFKGAPHWALKSS